VVDPRVDLKEIEELVLFFRPVACVWSSLEGFYLVESRGRGSVKIVIWLQYRNNLIQWEEGGGKIYCFVDGFFKRSARGFECNQERGGVVLGFVMSKLKGS